MGTNGDLSFVGCGQGAYIEDTHYRFVGHGGDFSTAPRRRDFTCLLCTILSLLLGLLAVVWYIWPVDECDVDAIDWQYKWSPHKQARCCELEGIGCREEVVTAVSTTLGPVDPFNCADGFSNWQADWSGEKKEWCCRIHSRGCGPDAPVFADWYDCDAGFANFVKGWSLGKKHWCCTHENRSCPGSGDLNMAQTEDMGYGAGAQHGQEGAPIARITTR